MLLRTCSTRASSGPLKVAGRCLSGRGNDRQVEAFECGLRGGGNVRERALRARQYLTFCDPMALVENRTRCLTPPAATIHRILLRPTPRIRLADREISHHMSNRFTLSNQTQTTAPKLRLIGSSRRADSSARRSTRLSIGIRETRSSSCSVDFLVETSAGPNKQTVSPSPIADVVQWQNISFPS